MAWGDLAMSSVRRGRFAKTRGCPTSHELLLLQSEASSLERSAEIISHLVGCDFCFAEVYFLSRHQLSSIPYEPAEMPEHLRKLALALLARREFGVEWVR
jgi:hypothetical protein